MSTQLSLRIQSNICMSFVGIKSLLSWLPPQFEHIKSSRAFSTLPPLFSHFTTGSKEAVQMILYALLKKDSQTASNIWQRTVQWGPVKAARPLPHFTVHLSVPHLCLCFYFKMKMKSACLV